MRKSQLVAALFAAITTYILLTSSSNGRATAANTGNTGAPNETSTCTSCHSGGVFGVTTVSIQAFQLGTTTPVTSYIPGTSYDMRVTVTKTSGTPTGYGFQMTALTTPGNLPQSGYSNLASNVKQKLITTGTYSGRTYVEHNGVTNNNQFNFRWTAPATGVGSIRFYAAGVCVNGNGGSGGDNGGSTSITLTQAVPLSATATSTPVTCSGQDNGTINLTVTGGVSPYTYAWSNGAISEDLTNLAPGNYSVTVTDAANATTTASATISQPTILALNTTTTDATTPGGTGTIVINASGGNQPYTFQVNGAPIGGGTFNTVAGCYTVQVIDVNGCTANTIACITQPLPYQVESLVQNTSCFESNDGSIQLNISGATQPYSYMWSDGATDEDRSNLSAGEYTIDITDINGYSYTETFVVSQPQPIEIVSDFEAITCYGLSTTLTISANGGTEPYNGTGVFTVTAGDYEFVITDANGCEASTALSITQPSPLTASATSISLPCTGGSGMVEVTAFGGTEPYNGIGNFEITSPGVYEYLVTDALGCSINVSSTVDAIDAFNFTLSSANATCAGSCDGSIAIEAFDYTDPINIIWSDGSEGAIRNDLCPGQYSFTISDGSGCALQGNTSISAPLPIQANINTSPVLCFGQSTTVSLVAQGGVGNFVFSWDNSTLSTNTTSTFAGAHTYGVSDSNGCSVFQEIIIFEPSELAIIINTIPVLCNGDSNGSASAVVTGGTAPYSYSWSNGGFSENTTNLPEGEVTLTVLDFNNCPIVSSAFVSAPTPLLVNVADFSTNADGTGQVDLEVTGGTAPYSFLWTTGAITEDVTLPANASNSAQVTDANGCVETTEIFITPTLVDSNDRLKLEMYPNPTQGPLYIVSEEKSMLRIYSAIGNLVHECIVYPGKQLLSLEKLNAGSYTIQVVNDRGSFTQSLIKE